MFKKLKLQKFQQFVVEKTKSEIQFKHSMSTVDSLKLATATRQTRGNSGLNHGKQ